jgi:hypothetical protein
VSVGYIGAGGTEMRYKPIFGFLLCLVLGMLVVIPACSYSDTPRYSKGEAIALVKRNLSSLNEKHLVNDIPSFINRDDTRENMTAQLTKVMLEGEWSSSYLGDGRWLVICGFFKDRDIVISYYVYEATDTIEELP